MNVATVGLQLLFKNCCRNCCCNGCDDCCIAKLLAAPNFSAKKMVIQKSIENNTPAEPPGAAKKRSRKYMEPQVDRTPRDDKGIAPKAMQNPCSLRPPLGKTKKTVQERHKFFFVVPINTNFSAARMIGGKMLVTVGRAKFQTVIPHRCYLDLNGENRRGIMIMISSYDKSGENT